MVVYFIHSFEWSREKVVQASKRLLQLKSPQNPDAVLEFLRSVSLSESQLSAAINRRPIILIAGVKSSLLPKVKLFESLGASGKELADLVTPPPTAWATASIAVSCPALMSYATSFKTKKRFNPLSSDVPRSSPVTLIRSPRVLIVKLENLSVACGIVEQFRLACTSS
ncbi:hypothetical protein NE237_013294 [Protea cynaroides]|uniref:Uncharacterized protein n=1 Tax=Protea cynaroides TaxID=273540 RepID=A0A9Q0GYE7_9MAGN|nr:hypothetical protein NE237_013294 [Protea cynaroides]